MRKASYHSGEIFYTKTGEGPVLFLIHGFCSDNSIWKKILPELKSNFTIFNVDLPGYGKSKKVTKKLSISLFADAIEAIIRKENLSKGIIAGHSMGGYVLCELLDRALPFIEKGIMIHSHPYADDSNKIKERQKINKFLQKNDHQFFINELYKKLFAQENAFSQEELFNEFESIFKELNSKTIMESNNAMTERKDQKMTLVNNTILLQFIIGFKDQIIDLETSLSQTYLPLISEVNICHKSGHLSMIENPMWLANKIINFSKLDL